MRVTCLCCSGGPLGGPLASNWEGRGERWEVEDRDADGEKQSWCVLWGTGARFANQALLDPNLARATADEALGRHYGGTAQDARAPVLSEA